MNRIAVVAIAGLALGGFAAGARASSTGDEAIEVHVPFAFHVEKATLPAGNYVIREASEVDPYLLEIRSLDSGQSALLVSHDGVPRPQVGTPSLVFERVGNDRYLHAIWADRTAGDVLPKSSAERRELRDLASRGSRAG